MENEVNVSKYITVQHFTSKQVHEHWFTQRVNNLYNFCTVIIKKTYLFIEILKCY